MSQIIDVKDVSDIFNAFPGSSSLPQDSDDGNVYIFKAIAWRLVNHGQLLTWRQNFEAPEGAALVQSEQGGQDGEGDSSHAATVRQPWQKFNGVSRYDVLAATGRYQFIQTLL